MTGKWVKLTEACQSFGISESTLRRRIGKGIIKSKLKNGQRLVLVESDNQMTVTRDSELVEQLRGEIEHLRRELETKNEQIKDLEESRQRQDTITLQLTRQLEQSQRLLEVHQAPWWRRWFRKRTRETE